MPDTFQVKIVAGVKTAYRGAADHLTPFLEMAWLYIFIALAFSFIDFFILMKMSHHAFSQSSLALRELASGLCIAMITLGFYRYLLLGKKEIRTFSLQQGISEKSVLHIPLYIKFGKRHGIAALLVVIFSIMKVLPIILLQKTTIMPFMGDWFTIAVFAAVINLWFILYTVLMAALSFVWIYLAVSDGSLGWKDAWYTVKKIRGNILRLTVIVSLIFLPAYVPYIYAYLYDGTQHSLYLSSLLSDLIAFFCLAAQLYVTQDVYKKIVSNAPQ